MELKNYLRQLKYGTEKLFTPTEIWNCKFIYTNWIIELKNYLRQLKYGTEKSLKPNEIWNLNTFILFYCLKNYIQK